MKAQTRLNCALYMTAGDPHYHLTCRGYNRESDLTDVDFFLETLNSTLFPGVPSSVEAHNGFADEQAQTAEIILAEVQSLMSQYSTTSVTVVSLLVILISCTLSEHHYSLQIGHSLGGAIAELDCLYFALNLPAGTTIKGVTYG